LPSLKIPFLLWERDFDFDVICLLSSFISPLCQGEKLPLVLENSRLSMIKVLAQSVSRKFSV
jgi:hypothetical protein